MDQRRSRALSYLSAGLLAAVTLFVFFVLQNYGPESAVRRFHAAVSRVKVSPDGRYDMPYSAAEELQRVTMQRIGTASVGYLVRFTSERFAAGGTFQIVRVERGTENSNQMLAAVVYRIPGYLPDAAIWVVEQPRDGEGMRSSDWKVNADGTANAIRDHLGF